MNSFTYTKQQILRNKWQAGLVLFFSALAGFLFLLASQLSSQSEGHINKGVSGIDVIVGAKGSPLQLVLSSMFFIDNPTGNIAVSQAIKWEKHPLVKESLPISLGDNYAGYKIVGTSKEYLDFLNLELATGESFGQAFETVLGKELARKKKLQIGDSFTSQHGSAEEGKSHDHPFKVVGILKSCNCPYDNVAITAQASFIESHNISKDKEEISALLLKTKTAMAKLTLPRIINQNSNLQAALPAIEADRLMQLSSGAMMLLKLFGYLFFGLCVLALVSAFMSRLKELLRDAAILQLSGFTRLFTIRLIVLEALILALLGFVASIALYYLLSLGLLSNVLASYGLNFSLELGFWPLLQCLALLVGSAVIAALIPLLKLGRMSLHQVISKEAY